MKVTRKSNWRVELEIEKPYSVSIAEIQRKDSAYIDKLWQTETDEVAAQVRRHVDGCEHVLVKWDFHEECAFCGSEWETEVDSEAPVCCKAALAEFTDALDTESKP